MTAADGATVIYVAYGTTHIDTTWVPDEAGVIVVHNDDAMEKDGCKHPRVRHVRPGRNLGFGAGVNAALPLVQTQRLVLCNPDTSLRAEHWTALCRSSPDEVTTLPLVDGRGRSTWVVNPHPTPLSLLLTAYRVGRLIDRDGALRSAVAPLMGRWGREHARLHGTSTGIWPLCTHWVSGAVLSMDAERLRAVDGFDERYFLYMEDVDLCRRLAQAYPAMHVRVCDVPPGRHVVGGSSGSVARRLIADRHHLDSARQLMRSHTGTAWGVAHAATAPRHAWLAARSRRSR